MSVPADPRVRAQSRTLTAAGWDVTVLCPPGDRPGHCSVRGDRRGPGASIHPADVAGRALRLRRRVLPGAPVDAKAGPQARGGWVLRRRAGVQPTRRDAACGTSAATTGRGDNLRPPRPHAGALRVAVSPS